jgi:hypothetical protein
MILWFALAIVLLFGYVVLFGAPYVPTLKKQQEKALDLLDLKTGQVLLELGSGDGRVLVAAAKRGIKSVGYELNPLLFLVSLLVTWRYRKVVSVQFGNYWAKTWPPADGIYVFLLEKYMEKLDKKITHTYRGKNVKVVSFAFKIPQRKAVKTDGGLYLYEYRGKT